MNLQSFMKIGVSDLGDVPCISNRLLSTYIYNTLSISIYTISLNLLFFPVKPLSVAILSNEHAPLSAGRKYDINCMTVGSRPPAKLSWYMDGKKLSNYTEKVFCFVSLTL